MVVLFYTDTDETIPVTSNACFAREEEGEKKDPYVDGKGEERPRCIPLFAISCPFFPVTFAETRASISFHGIEEIRFGQTGLWQSENRLPRKLETCWFITTLDFPYGERRGGKGEDLEHNESGVLGEENGGGEREKSTLHT